MPFWNRKKKNKNEPNFEGLNWQDNPIYEGKAEAKANPMSGYLQDMENSKTRHHSSLARFFTKGDSKEYSDVKAALSDVVQYTSGSFSNDAKANSQMMNDAVKSYHRLMRACQVYLDKKGGESDSGRARKYKVGQIMALAMQDYESVKTLSYSIRNMSVEEQSGLNWQQILQEARTVSIEVDDLSDFTALGDAMKTGDDAGRLLPQGVFTRDNVLDVDDNVNVIDEAAGRQTIKAINGFKNVAFNEEQEETLDSNKVGKTLNLGARNVATSRVANLLGIGGVVEQSQTVKVKEKGKGGKITRGNLMTLAKGSEASGIAKNIAKETKKMDQIEERKKAAGARFAPTVQKELSSLQVLDYICGQGDRHARNFFLEYDEEKKQYTHVHGIDNDMSFGTGVDFGARVKKEGLGEGKMRVVVDAEGNLVIPHMDKQLAQNIKNLTEEEFRFALEDLIEPAFLDAAVARLKKVQSAIHKEESKHSNVFVENDEAWGNDTMEGFLQGTAEYKVNQEAGEGEYFNYKYLPWRDKEKIYQLFRQNSYMGELMMDAMGIDFQSMAYQKE